MRKVLKLTLYFFLTTPPIANADWVKIHVGEIFNTYTDIASIIHNQKAYMPGDFTTF